MTDEWKLRELPVVVNRSREVGTSMSHTIMRRVIKNWLLKLVIGSLDIDHLYLSKRGLEELLNQIL